jgi:NADH-quinone oxidoreductase subunit M
MNIGDFPILSAITFLPLVGALVVALIPRRNVGAIRGAALAFSLAAWVVSLWLLLGYLPGRETGAGMSFQYVEQLDWIPLFGIQYKLGVDGLSVAMVVLTTPSRGSPSWPASDPSTSG